MRQPCYNCGISGLAQSYTGNASGWNMLKWRPLCKNGHCQTLPAHSNHSAKPCAWLPHAIGSRRQEPPGPHGDNKRPMCFHLPDVDMDKHLDILIYIYNIYIWILIWIWILILWCTDIIQLCGTAFPRLPCWITRWGLSPFVAKNLISSSEAPRLLPAPFQALQGVVHQRDHAEQPDGFPLRATSKMANGPKKAQRITTPIAIVNIC